MKRIIPIAIISLLMASTMVVSSCSNDDLQKLVENNETPVTEWTEPFHVKGASVVDVRSYMVTAMPGLSLTENTTKSNIQLVYSKSGTSEGIIYSFSPVDGGLYSVIDTEPSVVMNAILEKLHNSYTEVPASSEGLYMFMNADRTMVISIVKLSDSYFNVTYDFVSL